MGMDLPVNTVPSHRHGNRLVLLGLQYTGLARLYR